MILSGTTVGTQAAEYSGTISMHHDRKYGIVRTKILDQITVAGEKLLQLPITRKLDQTDISTFASIIHCIIKYNIMQFSFRFVAILAVLFLTSPAVTAENQIRVGLNNGVAHPDMFVLRLTCL
jgi:hypothetical protein